MRDKIYELVRKSSARAVNDIGKIQKAAAYVGAFLMASVNQQKWDHELAVVTQQEELTELKLLKATLEVKKDAIESGGFDRQHGPALTVAANALMDLCGWGDEDVTEWFGALVLDDDGENLGADVGFEEE